MIFHQPCELYGSYSQPCYFCIQHPLGGTESHTDAVLVTPQEVHILCIINYNVIHMSIR